MDLRLPRRLLSPHRGMALLLIVEMAIGALLCVLAWQCVDRYRRAVAASTGIGESTLFMVEPLGGAASGRVQPQEVVRRLHGIKGVIAASAMNQVPHGGDSWNTRVAARRRMDNAVVTSVYFGDEALLPTLGLSVTEGRALHPHEYETTADAVRGGASWPVLVTRGLTDRLYPGASPLGRPLYGYGMRTLRIVGIIDALPQPRGSRAVNGDPGSSLVLPIRPDDAAWASYLVRVDEGEVDAMPGRLRDTLARQYSGLAISAPVGLSQLRLASLSNERRWAWTSSICALGWWTMTLLSLTAAGHLWIQQSLIRIGLHRAVGATGAQIGRAVRWDHLRLAVLGLLLAFAIHRWLPWWPLPPSPSDSLPVWLLMGASVLAATQLVASGPARRAAEVTPDQVTRGR